MSTFLSPPLSSTPSARSSFSSTPSFATPQLLPGGMPHDLYTPAPSPPSISFPRRQHNPQQPIPIAPAPPSPPRLQPISSLAAFTAEMISWIWFATSPVEGAVEGVSRDLKASKRQAVPNDNFVRFCHDVLATTQVSHSVVILALLYIYRLKSNNAICGATGSEFRLATTALMLANKTLDDNTYTAKTWAEVSSLELQPLVAGEAEFLRGLDFSLHVTERDFDAWLKLLDGHVSARGAQLGKRRTSRKVGATYGDNVCSGMGGVQLLGLGLGGGVGMPVEKRARGTTQEEQVVKRRRVSPRTAIRPSSSSASTSKQGPPPPPVGFSFSQSQYPSSFPSTTFSSPLPSVPFSTHPRRPTHAHSHSYPAPPPSSFLIAAYQQQPSPPATGTKRSSSIAFSPSSTLPLEPHRETNRLAATPLSRSFSAGCSPAPPRSCPAQERSARRTGGGSGTFEHLADAFEPTSSTTTLDSLQFYSLAAGQRQGFAHTQPIPSSAFGRPSYAFGPLDHAPHSPVDYCTPSTPRAEFAPPSYARYANAGVAGVLWNPTNGVWNGAGWQAQLAPGSRVGWGYTP